MFPWNQNYRHCRLPCGCCSISRKRVSSRSIHVVANESTSLSKADDIPSCVYYILHLLNINRYLGCFNILLITLQRKWECRFPCTTVIQNHCTYSQKRNGLLRREVHFFLHTVSLMVIPVCVLANYSRFLLLPVLPNIYLLLFL